MSTSPRTNRIIETLSAKGECSVEYLARALGVSTMTIRRDLQALAGSDRVIRTHGGAQLAERVSFDFQFLQRVNEHRAAKQAMAVVAAGLIKDGQSVMLDSGTTTLALASLLKNRKQLTVITTSLPIASELQYASNLEVILLGGLLRRGSPDLTGPLTEASLENLRADVAFIGADAIDLKGRIYNNSLVVGRMLAKMAASAKRVYAIADSSKIGGTALTCFGRISAWDGLVIDQRLNRQAAMALKRARIQLLQPSTRKDKTA